MSKVVSYIQAHMSQYLNQKFEDKCRKRIKNQNFSIVCSTCIGGTIYHRLGQKFLTPTINMWFNQREFIKFIRDLPHYLGQELVFVTSNYSYPVAKLDDVTLYFNHAKTHEEAIEQWNRRKNRIQYDNLYIIMYDRDGITKDDILGLKDVQCKRLVVLSEKEYPDVEYVKTIRKPRKPRPNDCTFLDRDFWGRRTVEKQFDFVAWLNGEEKY